MISKVVSPRCIMDSEVLSDTVYKIINEILENNSDPQNLAVVGIRTRGVNLANRIVEGIARLKNVKTDLGTLDITLYRDDFRRKTEWPKVQKTEISFSIDNKDVILVDDVIFTGRTARAAIDALMDYGRPSSIQLAVLIDRRHRDLPIEPNYVGLKVEAGIEQKISVHLREVDGKDEVVVTEQ